MNPLQHSLIVGLTLAGLLAFEARTSADTYAAARSDYAAARTAVQQFEDAARDAMSAFGGNSSPEAIARARSLGRAAREALARSRRSIAAGVADGSLRDYSAPLLQSYEAELERDCARAEALLPAEDPPPADGAPEDPAPAPTPVRVVTPAPPRAEPADPVRAAATLSDEEIASELEADAKEIEEASALAENTYGYFTCPKTLQAAFDRLGVKSGYAASWGQWTWLDVRETYGRMATTAATFRACARQFRNHLPGASRAYAGYLHGFMSSWRPDRDRFFDLARRIIETQAKRAQALERGRAEGKLSTENEEAIHLDQNRVELVRQAKSGDLLRPPRTAEEWRGER